MENHHQASRREMGAHAMDDGQEPDVTEPTGKDEIVTAPVDPSDLALRRWFVERSQQIQAVLTERAFTPPEGQRLMPDFTNHRGTFGDTDTIVVQPTSRPASEKIR